MHVVLLHDTRVLTDAHVSDVIGEPSTFAQDILTEKRLIATFTQNRKKEAKSVTAIM